jgi:hypothetical protein
VAPPAVSSAYSCCLRGPDGHPPGPSVPPVHSTSRWKAKLQSLELSNLSSGHWNLVVHIPSSAAPRKTAALARQAVA